MDRKIRFEQRYMNSFGWGILNRKDLFLVSQSRQLRSLDMVVCWQPVLYADLLPYMLHGSTSEHNMS